MAHRVIVFGDSHVHAIRAAQRARTGASGPVAIEIYLRLKGPAGEAGSGRRRMSERLAGLVGKRRPPSKSKDLRLDDFLTIARRLTPDDLLVSAIGGGQHAIFSTIQHPTPFDFIMPEDGSSDVAGDVQLIPFRSLESHFDAKLRRGDGKWIAELRNATRARMIHLQAPPPKKDNEYIERHHDTYFKRRSLPHYGVSSPALRMKFWRLQTEAIRQICSELGVAVLEPPAEACEAGGHLHPGYYAGDATHANIAYGELVLRQLEQCFAETTSP